MGRRWVDAQDPVVARADRAAAVAIARERVERSSRSLDDGAQASVAAGQQLLVADDAAAREGQPTQLGPAQAREDERARPRRSGPRDEGPSRGRERLSVEAQRRLEAGLPE